jgi:hypothetical protein
MRRELFVLGCLAALLSGSALLVSAQSQDPCFPTQVVVPGGESRAALEGGGAGLWTFTILDLTPRARISQVDIQIYDRALPTSGEIADLYVVCSSCPDPYGRPQADCGTPCSGPVETAGHVRFKKVTKGASSSITLDAGTYCIRPVAFGKGAVTISISPAQ